MGEPNAIHISDTLTKPSTTESTACLVIVNTTDAETIRHENVIHVLPIPSTNRWDEVDLGLLQTIFSLWFKNVSQRVSVTLSIISTIIFSLLDNFSDFYVAYTLFYKGELTYACIVVLCDYIPGWQIAVHNLCFKRWRRWNNSRQKILTMILKPLLH